jgi:hypothetical protein
MSHMIRPLELDENLLLESIAIVDIFGVTKVNGTLGPGCIYTVFSA